jgi:hypothetical protein
MTRPPTIEALSHAPQARASAWRAVSMLCARLACAWGCVVGAASAADTPGSGGGEASAITFEDDVRPLLKVHCLDCHGATDEIEGGLDLRLVRLMQSGGDSGPALVPGDADASLLLQRVREGEMPPGEKKMSAAEQATITRWIMAGSPTKRQEPEAIAPGLGITPEERSFWAFQPVRPPVIPVGSDRAAIDVLLYGAESELPAEADRRTLVRRSFLTLTGLPPSHAEVERWAAETGADWFDRLVTELLDSPHYGEQWARHWLDVAGYADSEGATVADAVRPWAWRYRDACIVAFNDDVPFDRFIAEQLAGDELAGPRAGDWTSDQIRLLTATGFLRMAADGTGSGGDTPEGRNQTVADTIRIVGTSLLGLSVHCAQCHDHRYDPLLHTDYTALRAVFEPALDWQAWKPPGQRLVSLQTEADRAAAAAIEQEAQAVAKERGEKQAAFMREALEQELAKIDEPLREALRSAYDTPAKERTAEQKALLDAHPSVNVTPGVLYQYLPKAAEELKALDAKIAEIRATKPAEEFVRALVEPPGHVPETRLFHRGDHRQPKQVVPPAPPLVAVPDGAHAPFPVDDRSLPSTGRRLAFARWLTAPGNPLTARVLVNRVWMHHFGRGIVATPADFGALGSRPSHPALLDWLADTFVREGWSLKKLHRTIMTTAAWRQRRGGSTRDAQPSTPLVRLEAEAIRDRMLAVTGTLDRRLFGKPVGIKEDDAGQTIVDGPQTRRSLYVQVRRSRPVAMLQAFDAPVMETNCEVRPVSTVATQSLMLLNGEFILEQAAKLAERSIGTAAALDPPPAADLVSVVVPEPPEPASEERFTPHWIVAAWRLAYARDPSREEVSLAADFVRRQFEVFRGRPEAVPAGRSPSRQALVSLCQVLLGSNEFLYVE